MNETELRWQLRQLPREMEPGRDLWPAIAEAIAAPPRRRRAWPYALAAAASLALAIGLAWRMTPPEAAPAPDLTAKLLEREQSALTAEYQAALRQYQAVPVPTTIAPGLRELDRGAEQIRIALAADPDSRALFDQLKRTYSRRLELTRRAATG